MNDHPNDQSAADATNIAGRYDVVETLHVGQGCEVLLVVDALRPGRMLVLKRVAGSESERAERLKREYRLLSSLRHPGLPRALDFGVDLGADLTYLVCERAPGKTLDALGPLDPETLTAVAVDVCRALSLLHARAWLHLDVKPLNILHDPASGQTTLVDLDLAAFPESAIGRGTPPYASLEAMGSGPIPDPRTDLYSLGVTMHEALTGRPIPTDEATRSLDPGNAVPSWLRELIKDLTAPDREDRPKSAREVIRRLRDSGTRWPEESRTTRTAILSHPPFVGRAAELEALLDAIPPAARRRGRRPVAVVQGVRGVGRSRLIEEATREWRIGGLRVVRGIPAPGPATTLRPIHVLLDRLRRLSGVDAEEEIAPIRERLGRLDRLANGLFALVRRRRTVLVLEDIDQYDRPSRDFLLHFFRRLTHEVWESGRAPVEVVVSVSSEPRADDGLRRYIESESASGSFLRIDLEPLDLRSTGELVRTAIAPEPIPSTLSADVHDRTGGVPLFVNETLLSQPIVAHGSGTLLGRIAESGLPTGAVPRTLDAVVSTRLKGCTDLERELIQGVALFPTGVARSILVALFGESAGDALASLSRRGYVRETEGRQHLPDAISREVVARMVPQDRLRETHDRAADALETAGAADYEVAWHRLRGARPLEGVSLAWEVIPRLLADRAEEEAVSLLEEMIDRQETPPFAHRWARVSLSDLHIERGQLRQARKQLSSVIEETGGDSHPIARRLARLHHREGNLATARATIDRLLGSEQPLSTWDRLDLLLDLAEMLLTSGRPAETREALAKAFPLVREHIPEAALEDASGTLDKVRAPRLRWPGRAAPSVARFLSLKGDLARHDGESHVGLRCHLATVKIRSRLGDLVGLGRALHGIGTIFMSANHVELAERYYQRALKLRADVGDLAGQADTANNMGVLLRKVGRTAEAIDHYRTSLRLRRQIGHAAGEGFSYINIANVYYERRELDAAVKYYERALQVARRLSDARSQAQVLNNLGAVAHLRDRFAEAIHHYEEAESLDRMVGNVKGALVKRLNLAAELIRVGDHDEGARLVETVHRVVRRRGEHGLDAWLELLRGRLLLAAGELDGAEAVLAEAGRLAVEAGDGSFASEVAAEQAEVALRQMRPSEALAFLADLKEDPSREASAWLACVRARALLLGARLDRHAVESEVAEGERFARRSRMPGLEWNCAAARGGLRAAAEDNAQALSAYATGLEALEVVLRDLPDGPWSDAFSQKPEVTRFVADVDRLARGASQDEQRDLPGLAGALVRRVRDSLFAAGREFGVQEGVSRRNEEMMRRILEISRALRGTAPLDELFREIADGVVEFSGAERAFLLTVDERGRIRIPVARSREREPLSEPEQQVSRRIVSDVLENARSIRLTDAGGEYTRAESVVNLDLRSIMCAPMMRGSLVVGMLYVDNRSRAGQFTAADLELLDIFAAQAAIALENARLVREFARDEKIRVMGNLAGGVAHDFNNLLTAILGRAQQLATLTDDSRILSGLETITKAAEDGAVVVSRLQEFTRTRREGTFKSVNLSQVVDDVLEFTRARWEGDALRRGQRIVLERDIPDDVWVLGNLAELREVFTNLVLNSVAAMPEGGTLGLRAALAGEMAEVIVEDTGHGMTEEVRESIFDPYFTTRESEGSGLGMSIVYNVILRHEGTIRVESAPGEGTRIVLQLALAEPAEAPVPAVVEAIAIEPGRRVLVVEDEEGVRDLLADVLTAAGFTVEVVPGGPEALAAFEKRPADVVLTDLGMVPLTGWDVAREVKRMEPATPVILVTGWGGEIDQATAERNRVDLLLNKPFNIQRVVSCVQEAIRLRDLSDEAAVEES